MLISLFITLKNQILDKDAKGKEVELIQELVDLRLLHKVRDRVTVKSGQPGKVFEAYMLDVSQYTGSRKRRGLEIIEFWRPDHSEKLRRTTLIYNVGSTSRSTVGSTNGSFRHVNSKNRNIQPANNKKEVVQERLFP